MSTSYQDIDTRLRVVEDKLKLVMKVATVTKREPSTIMPGEFLVTQMSLEDLYKELAGKGAIIEELREEING